MKKRAFLLAAVLGSLISTASANVFVYDVNVAGSGPYTISYRLLDAAGASVGIEVFGPLPATTVVGTIEGTANEGYNQVNYSGVVNGVETEAGEDYGFRIVATKATGHADWTQISSDENTRFHFERPRGGIAINDNIESSLFGLMYVSNSNNAATGSGRPQERGIYALYPDASDPLGYADVPATGGITWWSATGTSSPFHVEFGPDGNLWIADWSDGHSGIWRASENLGGTFTEILSNAGRDTFGLVPGVHGSVPGLFIEEDGEGGLNLFWQDEDLAGPTTNGGDGLRNIYMQNITDATVLPISSAPTLVVDENNFSTHPAFSATLGLFVNDQGGGIIRDANGNLWVSQNRAVIDQPSLMQFDSTGASMLWDSRTGGGLTASITNPFLSNVGGLAISADGKTLFVPGGGDVFLVDVDNLYTDQAGADAVPKFSTGTGATITGIDLDPAGNVYVVSNISERLRIFSPGGANSFTFERSDLIVPGGAPEIPTAAGNWTLYN